MSTCRAEKPSGKKCALKNSFSRRRRNRRAPRARQRHQDHRHVEMALMVRCEHDRAAQAARGARARGRAPSAKMRPSGRIHVAWLTRRMIRTGQAPIPRREVDRLGDLRFLRRRRNHRAQIVERLRARELRFVDARLELIFERHHQLDALERAQAQALDRCAAVELPRARELREQRLQLIAA